jgi:HAE1 family hydrophobic/amphiphilic exporter-1
VGQTSGGMGASQSTAYKSEINENGWIRPAWWTCKCLRCKTKRKLEKIVGAKVKTVPGILGTAEDATLGLIVTGPDVESAMNLLLLPKRIAHYSRCNRDWIIGRGRKSWSKRKVDRDKMAALGLSLQTVGMTIQTAFSGNTDGRFRAGE